MESNQIEFYKQQSDGCELCGSITVLGSPLVCPNFDIENGLCKSERGCEFKDYAFTSPLTSPS